MPELTLEHVQHYLESLLHAAVTVQSLTLLGGQRADGGVKGYGYGIPVKIAFRVDGGEPRTAVLHTMSPGPFGHEHMSDRAQEMLWENQAFNRLPRHVRSLDVCGFQPQGSLLSLGAVEEFALLTDFAPGEAYVLDLERIRATGTVTQLDLARADALCDYLVEIHRIQAAAEPDRAASLYARRIRELVGSGECIMALPTPILSTLSPRPPCSNKSSTFASAGAGASKD